MHHTTNLQLKSTHEEGFTSLDIQYDNQQNLAWCRMKESLRPCFTDNLIQELLQAASDFKEGIIGEIDHVILASDTPGIFNLGGDLELFKTLIREKNHAALLEYALASIVPLFLFHTGFDRNITTISLVQGDALGAGFETAIAADVLIAEKRARMGLPEVLFNMFPGMGAYSFLSRKTSPSVADKMILSGKVYSAEELHEMGIVDILVEDGCGEKAVADYLKKARRSKNTYQAMKKVKRCCNPVTFEELKEIAAIWVDANMQLGEKDLRMMERLISRQSKVNIS